MNQDIDIVIPWVDGSDPSWQQQMLRFSSDSKLCDARFERYRDWGLLKYWFRGIEKNMPWVRKIHFITHGHLPKWINTKNPRLHIVKHSDYIPPEFLPVFSSHPIEMFLNKIDGLSEQFIYFNDDLFVIDKITPEQFFCNELPCDIGVLNALSPNDIGHVLLNNLSVIQRNFNKKKMIQSNYRKWFSLSYRSKLLRTVALFPWPGFTGFYDPHLPQAYLKSTFDEVWCKEKDILLSTARSRFRSITDVNQYLFRYWQLCTGKFHPKNMNSFMKYYAITDDGCDKICHDIKNKKNAVVVLNDGEIKNFIICQNKLIKAFDSIYPNASSFEESTL